MADSDHNVVLKRSCRICGLRYPDSVTTCPNDGSKLIELIEEDQTGVILNERFCIDGLIGQGGMGMVYSAREIQSNKIVAVKMLHAHLVRDEYNVQRFQQEIRTVSSLAHPNIIAVLDFGVTQKGQPFLVLEYLKGISLATRVANEGPMAIDEATKIFAQVCDALAHAHSHGVIHRDLKPSNIMLVKHDESSSFVKIVDFGLAKFLPGSVQHIKPLTQVGETLGSPLYMSPEQCQGESVGRHTDIYSFGCVMYEVLSGSPPIKGKNAFDTMHKHLNEMPAPLSKLRSEIGNYKRLEEAILKSLAKKSANRQQSMTELKEDIGLAVAYKINKKIVATPNMESVKHKPATTLRFSKPEKHTSLRRMWVVLLSLGLLAGFAWCLMNQSVIRAKIEHGMH